MSVDMTDIPKAQIEEEEKIDLEKMVRSLKLEIYMLRDDELPISTRIQAMEAAGILIYRVVDDGVKLVVFPHFVDYLKGIISVARKSTSEKDVYSVLWHISNAIYPTDLNDSGTNRTYFSFVPPFITEFANLTILALIKFRNELRVVEICAFLIHEILRKAKLSEEFSGTLLASGLIPTLAIILMTHSTHQALTETEEKDKESFVDNALEILSSVIRWWSDDASLISMLVEMALPVFHSILNSTAECIIKNGTLVIAMFLRRVGQETIGLKFVRGESGLHYILRIVAHILDSSNADRKFLRYAVKMIVDLKALVGENCELGEGLDEVSTAVLNTLRNQPDETATTKLLLIFSHLIQIQCDAVLNFLSKPVGSTGQNSLRFVIVDGLCHKYESFKYHERTTVKQALVRIDKYGLDQPEPQLYEESLEAVRALLLSLDAGDVGGTNVVDETLADHAEVDVRT